jgi:hypothetical protein
MNRRSPLLASLAALLLLLAAGLAHAVLSSTIAPSGKVAQESRGVLGYTGIAVSVPGTIVVRQGDYAPIAIEADDNLLPEIETVVEGGILKVRFKRKLSVTGRATIRLLVTGPTIESLAVAGSGDIVAEALKSRALSISVAGSGDVKIARLDAQTLKASVAGSGDIKVAGRAAEVNLTVAGSGDVEADRLESRRARVSIAGSGDVSVWAQESLEATVAGSGDIRYYGDPSISKKVAGSGSLKRLGSAP